MLDSDMKRGSTELLVLALLEERPRHGYEIGKVRAEEAWAAHLTYGFEVGQLLRLDAIGDVAWATDEASGLDRELLAGVGLNGTVIGPWQTVVNFDVGVPVAGPMVAFSGVDLSLDMPREYCSDDVHPSAEGAAAIAGVRWNSLPPKVRADIRNRVKAARA